MGTYCSYVYGGGGVSTLVLEIINANINLLPILRLQKRAIQTNTVRIKIKITSILHTFLALRVSYRGGGKGGYPPP